MAGKKKVRIQRQSLKVRITAVFAALACAGISIIAFSNVPLSFAANHAITGGSFGPLCNSGGYFTPSSMSIPSGDTVTISVPANDPYSGGLEVHGFPEGDFTVQNGTSHTTQPLTSNVSFYGSWPYTGCTKGSGTITVTHPAPPPPPPPPSPTPTPTPNPTPHPSPTPTPSPTPGTHPAPTPSPSPSSSGHKSASPSPAPQPSATTPSPNPSQGTPTDTVDHVNQPTGTTQPANEILASKHLSPQRKAVGFTSLFLAAIITGWIFWQLFMRKPNY